MIETRPHRVGRPHSLGDLADERTTCDDNIDELWCRGTTSSISPVPRLEEITDESLGSANNIEGNDDVVATSSKSVSLRDFFIETESNDESERSWSHRDDFFADSPYFNATVEKEMSNQRIAADTLKDIAKEAKLLADAGARIISATRRLSRSCRLKFDGSSEQDVNAKRESLGTGVSKLLHSLGTCLDEVANAQEGMYEVIEESLGSSFVEFVEKDVRTSRELRLDAIAKTEITEREISKHISRSASPVGSVATGRSYRDGGGIVSSFDSQRRSSSMFSLSSLDFLDNKTNSSPSQNCRKKHLIDVATGKESLHKIVVSQATSELARLELIEHFVIAKNQRELKLSKNLNKILQDMQYGSKKCFRIVGTLLPFAQGTFNELRKKHSEYSELWQKRHNSMSAVMPNIKQTGLSVKMTNDTEEDLDPNMYVKGLFTSKVSSDKRTVTASIKKAPMDFIENYTKFWETPNMLAAKSRCRRPIPRGVKLEGWLYKKSVSLFLSKETWERKWFMIKNGAIYELEEPNFMKEKICDLVLTTIRQVNVMEWRESEMSSNSPFDFQLIVPNMKYPITLRAIGPHELKTWMSTIRSTIDTELSRGQLLSKIFGSNDSGRSIDDYIGKEYRGRSTEINDTIGDVSTRFNFCSVDSLSMNPILDYDGDVSSNLDDDFTSFMSPLVSKVTKSNTYCAECRAANPDWVSLNLGILLCLSCSGVHRSLGVHISKVRSLSLDSVTDREAKLLLALGNDHMNQVWADKENSNDKNMRKIIKEEKPKPTSNLSKREIWIRNKYIMKKYMSIDAGPGNATSESSNSNLDNKLSERSINLNTKLFEAATKGDVLGIAKALAYGGDIKWKNQEQKNMTALQICLLRSGGDIMAVPGAAYAESVELLLQNGAVIDNLDNLSHEALAKLFPDHHKLKKQQKMLRASSRERLKRSSVIADVA